MYESYLAESLHEECGVFGIYDKTGETDMVSAAYYVRLYALQHRGQESCGIALNVDGVLSGYRDLGLVSEVFTKRVLEDAAPRRQDGDRPCPLRHRGPAQPLQRPAHGPASLQGRHGRLPQRQPGQRTRAAPQAGA